MKLTPIPSVVKGVLLFLLYVITARFGLEIDAVGGFATLVWLPTGISLAALFLLGLRYWPWIALGACATNFVNGAPAWTAIGISFGNTLEAVVGTVLLKQVIHFRPSLERVGDVVGLLFGAALVSTIFSATIGVASLRFGRVIEGAATPSTWMAWWIGDMISDLIVAPLLFVWSDRSYTRSTHAEAFELAVLSCVLFVVGLTVFQGFPGMDSVQAPITYVVFPPLIWASLRFRPRVAVTAMFFLSIFAVWSTMQGFGPFATDDVSESLLYLQSFLSVIALSILLLAAAVSERRDVEKRKDDFISIASHELKTPLADIQMFVHVIQRRLAKTKDKTLTLYISRIRRQIDRAVRLTVQLLDVGRLREGKMVLIKEKMHLNALIAETIQDATEAYNRRIDFFPDEQIYITADRSRIEQVMTNVLANAVKYSPRRTKIIVRVLRTTQNAIISVQDFGAGISIQEQAHIFDQFYRGKRTKHTRTEGLGLGLFIAREIIERHGGNIWVESPSGSAGARGSTFYFSLPLWGNAARLGQFL